MLGRDSTPFLRERGLTILRSIFGLLPRAVVSLPSLVFSTLQTTMESPCSPHLFYEKVDANFQVDFRPAFQGGDFTALAGVFNAPDNFGKPVQSTVLPRERGLIFLRSNFDLLSRAVISRLLLVLSMRQTVSDISIHAVLLPCTHQWRGRHGWNILLPRAVS